MARRGTIIARPVPGTVSMISSELYGNGSESDPDVICGKCDTVLVRRLPANLTLALRVVCFGCGAVNDLNQAAAN